MLSLIVVATLAFVGVAWALASPIGSSPDEDYHLTSIWCKTVGADSRCATRYLIDGTEAVETYTGLQRACFAGLATKAADCQEITTEKGFTDRVDNGSYPGGYYWVLSFFASPHLAISVVGIRVLNFGLFLSGVGAVYLLASPKVRRSLAVAMTVTLVPAGVFFLASVNPTAWAVAGIAIEFFALVALGEARGRGRSLALAGLSAFGAAMASVSRGDAGAYAVAVAVLGVWLIVGRLRRVSWRALAAIPPVVFGLMSFLGAKQVQAYGGASTGATGLSVQQLSEVLAIPLGNLGVGPMGSLGWLDTVMPIATSGLMMIALGFVVVLGMSGLGWWRGLGALGVTALMLGLPLYMLSRYGYSVGQFVQPRYVLPLLVVLVGVLLLADDETAPKLSVKSGMVVAGAVAIAHSAALYANIARYTHGSIHAALWSDPLWWWDLPVSPIAVWALGSAAFAVAVFGLLWLALAPPVPKKVEEGAAVPATEMGAAS
jgi:hypothetical protein